MVLAVRGQHPLDDELVGAPVPDAEDRRAEEDAGPGELGVGHRLPHGEEVASGRVDHGAPAADRGEPHERHRDRAADQHEHLEQVGIEHRAQAAEDGVDPGRDHDDERAGPEVDPHERLEDDAAGGDRHRDLGQHVADDRDHRQVPARARGVAALEELGHGEDAAREVERHEDPAQQEQDERGEDLELADRDAARGAGAGQPHQVLGADVGGEERGADHEPADVAAGQEVVGRGLLSRLLPPRGPGRDAEDDEEVEADDDPVPRCE